MIMFVIVDYTELYFQSHLFSDGIRSRGILEPLIKFLFVLIGLFFTESGLNVAFPTYGVVIIF